MKRLFLFAILFASLPFAALAEPGSQFSPELDAGRVPELEKLRKEFERRRAEALRPVNAWYRGQLEALGRKLAEKATHEQGAVARELTAFTTVYWQEDQPELKQALLATPWIWRGDGDANGVVAVFRPDGTMQHVGMRGTWRISGPNEVTVVAEENGEPFVLRFNASLSAYEGDHRGVSGQPLARPAGK